MADTHTYKFISYSYAKLFSEEKNLCNLPTKQLLQNPYWPQCCTYLIDDSTVEEIKIFLGNQFCLHSSKDIVKN